MRRHEPVKPHRVVEAKTETDYASKIQMLEEEVERIKNEYVRKTNRDNNGQESPA